MNSNAIYQINKSNQNWKGVVFSLIGMKFLDLRLLDYQILIYTIL